LNVTLPILALWTWYPSDRSIGRRIVGTGVEDAERHGAYAVIRSLSRRVEVGRRDFDIAAADFVGTSIVREGADRRELGEDVHCGRYVVL